ncbi:MAG: hypothetical protein IJ642_04975 [Oscillospiraceae bacterium]|nr:hypothetical protein [Oscillospiraceae bacterium]
MIQFPEISQEKFSELSNLIEQINQADHPEEFEAQLQILTGKPGLSVSEVLEYWGYTSLEDLVSSLLMPEPEKQNLSDSELAEIITAVYECRYSQAEMDYLLQVLRIETGWQDISDLIFYPEIDELSAIIRKILGKD